MKNLLFTFFILLLLLNNINSMDTQNNLYNNELGTIHFFNYKYTKLHAKELISKFLNENNLTPNFKFLTITKKFLQKTGSGWKKRKFNNKKRRKIFATWIKNTYNNNQIIFANQGVYLPIYFFIPMKKTHTEENQLNNTFYINMLIPYYKNIPTIFNTSYEDFCNNKIKKNSQSMIKKSILYSSIEDINNENT